MTDMPAVPTAETARRDEALSNACVDEYVHQPEVGPLEGALVGRLIEFGTTEKIFSRPADERTEAYVSGRFG